MHVPEGAPDSCPVCDDQYESVSVHGDGVMVGLSENQRYRRVCFDPGTDDGEAVLYFYHHTHEQAGADG